VPEAQDLLDELSDDQLTLGTRVTALERATLDLPCHPNTIAALRSLDACLVDLGRVRDALAVLHMATISRSVLRAFMPEAPLVEYLRGVYAWLFAVVSAMNELFAEIVAMRPDWGSYRCRIETARNFHFHELEREIAADLESPREDGDLAMQRLGASVSALIQHARALENRLDQRLG
jgi:hypothetical protein